jgi:hypothetical protein
MGTHDGTKHKGDTNDLESPLGIAQEPISDEAKDPLPGGDSSSRRSRARALGEDGIERQPGAGGQDEHDGHASIDMGYGGDGNQIKP